MAVDTASIAGYYDKHSRKMLRDYVYGNGRVLAAVNLVAKTLQGKSGRLLDIGCGIGTTSHAYSQRLRGFSIRGLDISPKSIEIAGRLFASDRVSFAVSDMSVAPDGGPYDAIVLVDVYEHIPRSDWQRFNDMLAGALSTDGTVILTTPTPLHQRYLQEHNPEALQIIDETVQLQDVVRLADDLNATLMHYSQQSVWNSNDYLHVVLQRKPRYAPKPAQGPKPLTIQQRFVRKIRYLSGLQYGNNETSAIDARRQQVFERLQLEIPATEESSDD